MKMKKTHALCILLNGLLSRLIIQASSENKGYTGLIWNRCHNITYVNVYNVDLKTCISECGFRHLCKGLQYSRKRKSCGLLSVVEIQSNLDVCPEFVYIAKGNMQLTNASCGHYDQSENKEHCVTECEVPFNPRNFSTISISANPTVGTKIKIACNRGYEQMSVTCGRNGTFDKLPNCDPYIGENLAFERPTLQSSTHGNSISDKAVDTIISSRTQDYGCTHTQNQYMPWLIIELDYIFYLQKLEIVRRTNFCCPTRLSEVYIYTSANKDDLMSDTVWNAGILCDYRQGPFTEQPVIFNCTEGVRGQYVKIVLNKKEYLELCDVKIYGHLPHP